MTEPGSSPKVFLGALLMAGGGLIATLCGLCSVLYLASVIPQVMSGRAGEFDPRTVPEAIATVLLVGGVPALIGAGIFWLGWRLSRGPRRSRKPLRNVSDTFE